MSEREGVTKVRDGQRRKGRETLNSIAISQSSTVKEICCSGLQLRKLGSQEKHGEGSEEEPHA